MRQLAYRIPQIAQRLETHYQRHPVNTVAVTRDGFRMNLNTSDFIQRTIYLTGDWDHAVSAVLRERLKPGYTFVDAGANVGFFSMLAAKLVGPTGKVIAFEPNPNVFESLKANSALNGFTWIEAHQKGLFDKVGGGTIYIPEENCGAASMRPGGQNGVPIPLVRLDDIVLEKVDLLKIDIEGAEVGALRGAHEVLSNCPSVVCEVSEYSLKEMGSSKDELYDVMVDHGYTPAIISQVRRSNICKERIFFQYDVLFTKEPA